MQRAFGGEPSAACRDLIAAITGTLVLVFFVGVFNDRRTSLQFRKEYLFHAPTNYETNYVDITAPVGYWLDGDTNISRGGGPSRVSGGAMPSSSTATGTSCSPLARRTLRAPQ